MGYAWKGVCYQDTASALNAFARDVPTVDAVGILSFTASPTINGTGLVSWSISHRPLTGTTATTRTGTTQLQTCATESFAQFPEASMLFFVALFFAAMHGFKTGWK